MQQVSSFQNQDSGTLYLVPTPIGNLDDMTFRAVKVLTGADLIAAEDTRHTQQLLNHFDIHTPEISFHEHNTEQRIPELIGKLKAGLTIVQCSDAGMPSISDPGKELVAAAVKEGIPVVPLPGANAGLTALIASGLVPQPFYFYGFLERKHQQQVQELEQLRNRSETMIFYEAPHRLKKTLKVMAEVFGDDRQAVLARELTKRYEEFSRGSLAELTAFYDEHQPRGEYVVLIAGNPHPDEDVQNDEAGTPIEQIDQKISEGLSTNAAIKLVAKKNKLNRQELYKQYHNI
ncbi:16S rRNA (cytidine(1402)-2'-O)-methyltransferase [Limosilactobacillus vaginalis]|jgi:16S rRNA (cytidine1402-2'-O)-methyltransferase|uniref:Ribosomal RNA small subunit methyltransferase I n=1 Tax=Limosilactobacillus vaginalis DSM 5837 = ATCC 49540 TaxID=1423814 RepID=C2ETB6_9LACO|nr:16S rRNA (cytidine(1402)-2'-O)-methyltransferase [Limosilactobacillus vaginalis]EEJ40899.1 S-adenosylmethionine-dependent methyltransferase, YraL family [Limosilactobacillus vaginalis DSM 5837 = ATCC 49540]KRM49178.1 tetrapyrrole (corrin porphyrin) methyltransferase [Limosilactobacillus vaginalis DSM 5837 = ATCC 49540]MDM8243929.1 16S rRNA (cytidine(1402)-2'-O)-methyltransferase [Limosilactobacillus vaginalis]MDM8259228.1 16S rRNA (cytidine(1402)-2'-O)-methyltransferase [Limosilactobacillus 